MKALWIVVITGLGLSLGLHVYHWFTDERLAFVSVPDVYNGFEMKQELEKEYQATVEQRKLLLDSLKFQYNRRLGTDEAEALEQLKREVLYREQQFQESNQVLLEKTNEEILQQLNVYMKAFGEETGFDLILGANGNGNLIHAKEELNVTEQMVEFVNEKYRGE